MIAITRGVSPSIDRCEVTHIERTPIDYARASQEHEAYEEALRSLGFVVRRVAADAKHPDCVFIEDTAIVLDELAVITRPGASSRRGETRPVEEALRPLRRIVRMTAPGTLDGGDVLRIGRTLYVGASTRTSSEGIRQLGDAVRSSGYEVVPVRVPGCLHLKSAVTEVAPKTLLANRALFDTKPFAEFRFIDVDPAEPHAGNALLLGDTVVYSASHPRTARRLRDAGLNVVTVPQAELAKAEGGVTCCSLIVA